MTDLADLSLVEAADAVRNGEATSMELLDACWRNMEAANPRLNATIWLDREARGISQRQYRDGPAGRGLGLTGRTNQRFRPRFVWSRRRSRRDAACGACWRRSVRRHGNGARLGGRIRSVEMPRAV